MSLTTSVDAPCPFAPRCAPNVALAMLELNSSPSSIVGAFGSFVSVSVFLVCMSVALCDKEVYCLHSHW